MANDDDFWLPIEPPHFSACLDHIAFEWWQGNRKLTIYCDDGGTHWIASVKEGAGLTMVDGTNGGFVAAYRWLLSGGDISALPAPATNGAEEE